MLEFSIDEIIKEIQEKNINIPFLEISKNLQDIKYKPISVYPFISRDVAVWVPGDFSFKNLKSEIQRMELNNFEKVYKFDEFTKTQEDGTQKTSIAFRIIFQSHTETLTDEVVEKEMHKVNEYLKNNGFEIR